MNRLLVVGLDEPECVDLKKRLVVPTVFYDMLPRIQVNQGRLLVEKPNAFGAFMEISKVIFHGIFEDDFPFLSALALWSGPCLPNAHVMMDCRLRLPGLVRALEVTRFGSARRGFADRGSSFESAEKSVAKWGEWHCGENKELFHGSRECKVPTLMEPFIEGQAVRIHLMGDQAWQIRLTGNGWKKSLHGPDAGFMDIDPELLDDTRRLQKQFRLDMLGVDYMIGADGTKHLLEVNHIPNVTVFPEIREAFLGWAAAWANEA